MSTEERNEAIAIVNEMVEMGYHLFGETVEHMVDRTGFHPSIWALWRDKMKRGNEGRA